MKKRIEILSRKDASALNNLRRAGYASAKGFTVSPEGLNWNQSDDDSLVLGAFDGSLLVSTMRLELIDSHDMLSKKLECEWSFPKTIKFPVALLSRAATLESHRALGFNALLRYHCLRAAIQMGATAMVGTFVTNSPRVKSMIEMGYELFEQAKGWTSPSFSSQGAVSVAYLDLLHEKTIQKALGICCQKARKSLEEYPMTGLPKKLQPMRVIA